MQRRRVLRAFGAGGAASLAGCGGRSVEGPSGGGQTEQAEGGVPPDGLSDDQLQETVLSDSLAEFGVTSWARTEEVRVYDESADDLTVVEPENGWFLEVSVGVYNAGGDSLEEPEKDDFSLFFDGSEHDRITELPGEEFTFDDIREYYGTRIEPNSGYFPGNFGPDSLGLLPILFDVGSEPIEWAINVTGALDSAPDQDQYVYYSE